MDVKNSRFFEKNKFKTIFYQTLNTILDHGNFGCKFREEGVGCFLIGEGGP